MANPTVRKPPLEVVREGNPGHKVIRSTVKTPPAQLVEPPWSETFRDAEDMASDEVDRCRMVASREWQRIVPVLSRTTGLGDVDATVLHDFCVCVARIDQCERIISRDGLLMKGERGWMKNGATTIAGQYRQQLVRYIGELGLSPSARGKLPDPEEGSDASASPFDV